MQTTLLTVAIAIILAVVAALVGPLLIDWNGYRSIFETQASHVVGAPVRVSGAIDLRLLPSPRLTLNDIQIGAADGKQAGTPAAKGADETIRARSLGIEFALAPLLRGDWRATELTVAGPRVNLSTDAAGHVRTPGLSFAFNADDLAIDKLSIEDGTVTVAEADGATLSLERVWFNGEARSLLGPFKGEGAATIGGELYPYRLSSGRYGEDGTVKVRLNVDPVNRPLSIETEGILTLAGVPQFEGTLKLAKPVGIAPKAGGKLTQPWRVTSKLKANAQSALLEQVEFLYGPEEQGLKLTGVADFKFGKAPRFEGVLSGRQIDLDRVLAAENGARPPPAAAIRDLIQLGGGAFAPSFPISLGIGIDQVTLGGNVVQNLRGDLSSDASGWNLDRFEFRAPGYTQVKLSGHLAVDAAGVAFTGPAEIDASDPKLLAAWLEGRSDKAAPAAPIDISPLSIRGDVTVGSEKVAIDGLKATFDRKVVSGRFAYTFASRTAPSKLDAALNAPDLDLDATLGFGMALVSGSTLERPRDMTIAFDIGRASVGGFTGRNASARLKVDGDGLQIDKLSVADLGGAAFSASGRIDTRAATPRGSINVDLNAPDMAPVFALLSRFAPATVGALSANAAAMAPAKLQARLNIDGAAPAAVAKLAVQGRLGQVRLALNAQGNAATDVLSRGDLKIDGTLDADDGKTLLAMLGLDRAFVTEPGPASLKINLNGPASGDQRLDARLAAKGLEATAKGTAQPFAAAPTAALRTTIARANISPMRGRGAVDAAALPLTFDGRVVLSGDQIAATDINAAVGGGAVRGKLAMTLAAPRRLSGDIEADNADAGGLLAAAIGMPSVAKGNDKSWVWSTEPFTDGVFGNYAGSVTFKARRLDLTSQIAAREFRARLDFADRALTIGELAGDIGGGRLSGSIAWQDTDLGLKSEAKLALNGADAAALLPAGPRPPVTGKLDLSADIHGSGLSPIALIGSLQGEGKVVLVDGQLAGLDPRVFDTLTHAVDQGVSLDNERVANIVTKALDSGRLAVKRAELDYAVSAGQLRLAKSQVESAAADLAVTGNVDLTDGTVDARLVLSGHDRESGSRPDIFLALRGPAPEPSRSVDVSAVTGWLTLRAVDNQAKRLKALEAAQPKPEPAPAPVVTPPQPPAPAGRSEAPDTSGSIPAPRTAPAVAPPAPRAAPKREMAPALPAPLDIKPAPQPGRAVDSRGGPTLLLSPQN